MNKTVTCNIAGLVFHIEEQAYDLLFNYLNGIKTRIAKSEGAEEIIQDIEARIAELFTNSISNRQEVILEKNVNEVITALGKPEDFEIEDDSDDFVASATSPDDSNYVRSEKTLMRDTENGVIAGVCSGLAAYLKWDVVLVRVLFILALILTGFGFIVYIVLWIAAPKAQSSTDRLRMQGKPINLDTIAQEVQDAADRLERYTNSPKTKKSIAKIESKGKEFGSMLRKFFGALLFVGGVLGMFFFLTMSLVENGFFIDQDGESPVSLYHFSSIMFNSDGQAMAGWYGLLSLVLLPLLFLTIAGIFMIFSIRGKAIGRIFMTFLGFWIVGVITFSLVSAQIARDFTYRESAEKELFSTSTQQLYVEIPDYISSGSSFEFSDNDEFFGISHDGSTVNFGQIRMEVIDSKDSLFHVTSLKHASGISRKKAYLRILNMQHSVVLDSNKLTIEPEFKFPIEDRLRNQKIVIRIAIPKNAQLEWIGNKRRMYEIRDYRELPK